MNIFVKAVFAMMLLASSVQAANIIQMAVDERGIPFLLDDAGHVWAFQKPFDLLSPFKLPNLEHIKKIAPYIAVDAKGQVFTWNLNEAEIIRDEDVLIEAAYTKPQRVDALKGVTMIASSIADGGNTHYLATHFVAVIGDRDIVDWIANQDSVTGSVSYGPVRKVISREGVKAVALASWGGIIQQATLSSPEAFDTADSLVALFDDGSVFGWGINQAGQTITPQWGNNISTDEWKKTKGAAWKSVLLTKSLGARGVAMDTGHVVILTAKGIPQYWGGCAYKSDKYSPSLGTAKGVEGYIDGAVGMTVMSKPILSKYDYVDADVYVEDDGSLWAVYAPALPEMPNYCLGATEDKQKAWRITLGASPAIQVSKYLALDAAHNVWVVGRMHRENRGLVNDRSARLLLSPSREISLELK